MGSHRAARAPEGQHRRMGARAGRSTRSRRRGALARRRPARLCRLPVRGADLAARDVPVRRPGRSHELRAGRRDQAGLYERFGLGRPAVPSSGGRRPGDDRAERGAGGPQSGASRNCSSSALTRETSRSRLAIPNLEPEHAFGFDLSLRWRSPRASGEVTYFRNDISDFVFTAPLTHEEFEAREDEFAAAVPRARHRRGEKKRRAGTKRSSRSSSTSGPTASCRASKPTPTSRWPRELFAEFGLDYVRGTLKDSDDPLPRIPPLRFRGGLRYQYNGVSGRRRSEGGGEAGSRVLDRDRDRRLSAAPALRGVYVRHRRSVAHTITARLDNATNELYRNHLVADQGSGSGDGAQLQAALQREVLKFHAVVGAQVPSAGCLVPCRVRGAWHCTQHQAPGTAPSTLHQARSTLSGR